MSETSSGRGFEPLFSEVVLPAVKAQGPDVTVIVICYNDAEHLADAVHSVLSQTLSNLEVIISDDHSTDETPEVARALCEEDSRVRYHRLAENSGGCGAPRNEAIDLARGDYIMFLDSDDTLDRHACKNLLLAAVRDGAEICSGKMIRRYLAEEDREDEWYGWLYQESFTLTGIDDRPEQIHDTAVTNKLYSRAFFERTGIRFPVDIHYEDMMFSAQTMSAARGITTIPETVYIWNVYPTDVRKSISNRRDEMKNLRDRLYAVDIANEVYSKHSQDVVAQTQDKVLNHHLRLYLNDMLLHDDDWAQGVLTEIIPWVEGMEPAAFERRSDGERAMYACVLSRDLEGIRAAVAALNQLALSGNIYHADGAVFWAPRGAETRPLNTERARELSDFSKSRIVLEPHAQLAYSHRVENVRVEKGNFILEGQSTDALHKLRSGTPHMKIRLRNPSGTRDVSSDLQVESVPSGLRWTAKLPLPRRAGFQDHEGRQFTLNARTAAGAENLSPVNFVAPESIRLKDTSLLGRLLGDNWILTSLPEQSGQLEIAPAKRGQAARRILKAAGAVAPVFGSLSKSFRRTTNSGSKFALGFVYPLMRKLPLKRDQALFEANMGGSAFDNPRGIYEELHRTHPELETLWSWNGDLGVEAALPEGRKVRRGSYRYLYALARSSYLIDNQSLPKYFVKRDGQRYLQTWHGIPLKKMGYDEPRSVLPTEAARIEAHTAKWDGLNVASHYFEEVFVPAYRFTGDLVRYGSPRLDALQAKAASPDSIRRRLDVPGDRKIVLYAPTFRENARRSSTAELLIDLERWNEELGDSTTLLIRAHYLNRFFIPQRSRGLCIDVSGYPNITDLYAVADVLITDYSSVMFDYSHLGRPEIIFAPDYEQYANHSRGTYFDLREWAPGPFVTEEEDLFDAVKRELAREEPDPRLIAFRDRFAGSEDGLASRRSVEYLLGASNAAA